MLLDARARAHEALAQGRRQGRRFHSVFFLSTTPPVGLVVVRLKERKKGKSSSSPCSWASPLARERADRSRSRARVEEGGKAAPRERAAEPSMPRASERASEEKSDDRCREGTTLASRLSKTRRLLRKRRVIEVALFLPLLSASSIASAQHRAELPPPPLSLSRRIGTDAMPGEEQTATTTTTTMLALDAAPSESAPSWRARGAALVDALPYVDSLTPSERALTDRLIESEVSGREMKKSELNALTLRRKKKRREVGGQRRRTKNKKTRPQPLFSFFPASSFNSLRPRPRPPKTSSRSSLPRGTSTRAS